jgi:hypothetical protein
MPLPPPPRRRRPERWRSASAAAWNGRRWWRWNGNCHRPTLRQHQNLFNRTNYNAFVGTSSRPSPANVAMPAKGEIGASITDGTALS